MIGNGMGSAFMIEKLKTIKTPLFFKKMLITEPHLALAFFFLRPMLLYIIFSARSPLCMGGRIPSVLISQAEAPKCLYAFVYLI